MNRHKVFISYHHTNDQQEKDMFVEEFGHLFHDRSVRIGDISDNLPTETIRQQIRDNWLRDSTVTIVLIGEKTWSRKHVDWEIGSSLRQTKHSSRSGLLGILLPSYFRATDNSVRTNVIPPRLVDNISGPRPFAYLNRYPTSDWELLNWIEGTFLRRDQEPPPHNSRPSFGKNRPGEFWTD